MKDGQWRTLEEIERATKYPTSTASAGLRGFRRKENGENIVDRKYLGDGVYSYKLILNESNDILKKRYD